MTTEFVVRLGFVCGNYEDPQFNPDQQQPYVLDSHFAAFGLQAGFAYPVLIGMDVIGQTDFLLRRDGRAQIDLA